MGTNYYLVKNGPTSQEPIHIGKSSIGWLFHFQSQNRTWDSPPVVWNTYNQVKDTLKRLTVDSDEFVIIDEYDEVISFDDFCELVDRKQEDPYCLDNEDNFAYNVRNMDGYRFDDQDFC